VQERNGHDSKRGYAMYRRVLVALDGSEPSNAALHEALKIVAGATEPALRLINVVDVPQSLLTAEGANYGAVFDELAGEGKKIVESARKEAAEAAIEAETAVVDGELQQVADVIAAEAAKWQADVIVAGTHGRHGVGRLLLGSVAEAIARESAIPVLLVRQRMPSDHG